MVSVLSHCMTYPRTAKLNSHDPPAATVSYTCDKDRADLEAMDTALQGKP